jgi:PBP1b-binding outer membrane lipoprotein LpoB
MTKAKSFLLILLTAITFTSCSTVKQAQKDFNNFKKTIELNADAPVVYKYAYY